MTFDTKGHGVATVEFKAELKANGKYDLTLSVPTTDRDDEVVDALAFAPLPTWIPIDIDHGMTVLSTVGSGTPAYEGEALKLHDFSFASTPLAQDVKTLVDEKHIRKLSVAFLNAVRETDEEDGKTHIRSAELLNAAIVAIPSNREANILVGKSLRTHPLTVAKAVAGSYEDRADRLRQSLRTRNPVAQWLWVRATFDDAVVYELEADDGAVTTWRIAYVLDGDSFTFGDPTEVDLAEVIVPPVKSATDPEKTAAAPAAAVSPAEVTLARAYAVIAEAEAALL